MYQIYHEFTEEGLQKLIVLIPQSPQDLSQGNNPNPYGMDFHRLSSEHSIYQGWQWVGSGRIGYGSGQSLLLKVKGLTHTHRRVRMPNPYPLADQAY